MHNKETIIGIALLLLGDGIGGGLQMLGLVNPYVGWVIIALSSLVGIGLLVYGIKIKDNKRASQIYDADMGGHLNKIKIMLETFKKQLMVISNKKGFLGNLEIAIEKQKGFYQVWEHCPSIKKTGQDLRVSRILHEAKVKGNLVTVEDDTHIRGRIKALADAIENCLSDGEYLNHSCSNCIEKRNQLSGISNEDSLVLTPHTWAIGLSGMTGYPAKPDNTDWLCLEVAVKPISKPIDTLDLLIESETIHANHWPGKNVAAFRVYFNITDWRWKGEIQVELQARIQGVVRSSVRIPIDFNVEPFGRHPI